MSSFVDEVRLDVPVGRLAECQHGVVALRQLRELGLSTDAAVKRVQRGRLYGVHRGVYAVGHPRLTRHGRWMAAVLACGSRAALSHRSAAALWGMRDDGRTGSDVSVPRGLRARPGISVHTMVAWREADLTRHEGVPCTSPARTLLDLAAVLDARQLERALEQAEQLRLFDLHALEEVITKAGGHRGTARLRRVLASQGGQGLTASELEERFLALCRRGDLPPAEVNTWLVLDDGAVKPDFLWRAQRLVVELDGHAYHGTRQAFERDRLRDQRLVLAGFRVLRYTWRQVDEEPLAVAATVRSLLAP